MRRYWFAGCLALIASGLPNCRSAQEPQKPVSERPQSQNRAITPDQPESKPQPLALTQAEKDELAAIDKWTPEPSELVEKLVVTPEMLTLIRERMKDFTVRTSITEEDDARFAAYWGHPLTPEEVKTLEETAAKDSSRGRRFLAVQLLSQARLIQKDFAGAAAVWKSHPIAGAEKLSAAIIKILERPEETVTLQNAGPPINSNMAEYDAVLDLTGNRIYFTRYDQDKKRNDPPGEEIWLAEKKGDSWSARPLAELNTPSHESVLSASPDGSSLFIFGHYPGSQGNGDIFKSTVTRNGWSTPKPLPAPVNSPFFESDAMMSPNGKALVFASDRPGGYYPFHPKQSEFYGGGRGGNVDLYVTFIKPDGSFTVPRNLGPVINTPASERNPYLHSDGKTLYFSSDGHPGLGDHDIFRSVRLDDTWIHWSEPENLGRYINGPGDDTGFRMNAHGTVAYVSGAHEDTKGTSDIYSISPLPKNAVPAESVSLLRGFVKDPKGEPVEADVEWKKKGDKESEGKLRSRADTGEYVVPLAQDRKYDVQITKPGFINRSFEVKTPSLEAAKAAPDVEIPVTIKSDPAYRPPGPRTTADSKPRKAFAHVYFNIGGVRPQNPGALKKIIAGAKADPASRIVIEAHADGLGNPAFNRQLSEKRARAVYSYLVARGIEPRRISYRGVGSSRPAASNRTNAGRKANRRAVVQLLPGP